jgi:hypothetical protein
MWDLAFVALDCLDLVLGCGEMVMNCWEDSGRAEPMRTPMEQIGREPLFDRPRRDA